MHEGVLTSDDVLVKVTDFIHSALNDCPDVGFPGFYECGQYTGEGDIEVLSADGSCRIKIVVSMC